MDIETQVEEPVEDSIRGDLEKAFADVEATPEPVEKPVAVEKPAADIKPSDESGKFAKKSEETKPELVAEKIPDAPRSWTAAEKAEWVAMTPNQRAAVMRRESEVELGFTKLDEDRSFGKSLKEVITPYMPIIQAEGGTPQTAIQALLNTAYILRTAPAAQKTALFHQLAQQYGVDLSQPNNTAAVQPNQILAQTQQELAQLKQEIQKQPEVFRQQQENLAVKSQIEAFAADPKNVHYEKLKPLMASLLQSGQAKDLQDAYDKASWVDPDIRSAMNSDQQKAAETQRMADIKAQADKSRKAAVSVRGSPSISPVANGHAAGSIADDLRAAWDEHA